MDQDTKVTNEEEVTVEPTDTAEEEGSRTSDEYTDREKQLYQRLKKEQARVRELENAKVDEDDESDSNTGGPQRKDLERIELIALGYKDKSELEFIMRNGGIDALEDPIVAKTLKTLKQERQAADKASVGVSSKSGVSKQYTAQQISKMTSEEYAAKVIGYQP